MGTPPRGRGHTQIFLQSNSPLLSQVPHTGLDAQHLKFSKQPGKVRFLIPILQLRKLRLSELRGLVQGDSGHRSRPRYLGHQHWLSIFHHWLSGPPLSFPPNCKSCPLVTLSFSLLLWSALDSRRPHTVCLGAHIGFLCQSLYWPPVVPLAALETPDPE